MLNWILIIGAYLMGSIPFGYIYTMKFEHIDITTVGSGNIGSTNVGRAAGKKVQTLTQVCDILKGMIPVAITLLLLNSGTVLMDYIQYFVAIAAVLGHDYSIFMKFKGGKGVNTTVGALFPMMPIVVLLSALTYKAIKSTTKYVSLGSICLGLTLPLYHGLFNGFSMATYYLAFLALLLIYRHRANVQRLLSGTENKAK